MTDDRDSSNPRRYRLPGPPAARGGDLESQLRAAFEAGAAQVTPDSIDTDREHAMRRLLAGPAEPTPIRRSKRGMYAAVAGLAAAGVIIGAAVSSRPPTGEPQVASDPGAYSTSTGGAGLPEMSPPSSTSTGAPPAPSGSHSRVPQAPRASSTPHDHTPAPSDLPSSPGAGEAPSARQSARTPMGSTGATSQAPQLKSAGGATSGPLTVPSAFVNEGELSSIPLPDTLTYDVLSSGTRSVEIRVDNYLQLVRYLNEHSPLAGWPRADGTYRSPNSTMAAQATASGDGDEGRFRLFTDPADPDPEPTTEPSTSAPADSAAATGDAPTP